MSWTVTSRSLAGRGSDRPTWHCACEGVSKTYHSGERTVRALVDVDLHVDQGEFLSVIGASGCGKSTLLSIVAGLDAPTAGELTADGRVALMFQDATLLPWLTARGNVELALKLRGVPRAERADRARELLDVVRLGDATERRPARAVRRDAPTGRPGPLPGPGRPDRADGRAARGAGRDDPRPPPRRDRTRRPRAEPHRHPGHPQHARGRPPGRPGRARWPPGGSSTSRWSTCRTRGTWTPRRSPPAPPT